MGTDKKGGIPSKDNAANQQNANKGMKAPNAPVDKNQGNHGKQMSPETKKR